VLAEKGLVYKFESAIFRKDGKIIWISENARAMRDESGTVLYYEGTVEDITELKQAEERIRSQAALLDMARDAIMVQDLLHRVEYWNPSAARIYGWSAAEVLGQNAAGLIYRDPTQFNRALAVVLEKGGWSGEMKQARKDGTEVIVETSWTLVRDARGQPRSILAINTDVTERKRLENQVAHTQRMESIGTLAGGIAHDFNNILSIITGYAALGRTTVPSDHVMQRSLAAVERAVERAQGVVRQILTFSRQKEPERSVIAVAPVVQEALQFLRSTLPAKIEIVSEFADDLPPILADATQLHQIIMNLGTNAAHAMRGHAGRLEVRVSSVNFEGSQGGFAASLRTGRYVRLMISDNGCGMDSRTLQRIFEPFFTTKNLGEGTGLGLAVVHGIVKNHDGAITVNSEVGKGTVFHLYFPALEAPEEKPKPALAEAPSGHGRRVLYVDDEPGIVEVTTLNLQTRGFAACGFQFPEEALEAFRADPGKFDAAVVDLSMPRMEGPELARQMLVARPGLPIVVVSGYLRADDQEKLRKLGITHVLEKPFSVTKLSAVLEQLLAISSPR
jgi:PAS domain S-box-containing protein